ncbi:hypothetical protein [Megalodesulfovibrio paquesii]
MEMCMDMWRIDPERCGFAGLITPRDGLVGYLVAMPLDESPYFRMGEFDLEAFEAAELSYIFPLTREGFRAAHQMLRADCKVQGHTLVKQ